MATLPILPSLSRAPDFSSGRKLEDGTLRSDFESGYVSTRPRFTRLRRTHTATYKNLIAEDIRALDAFEVAAVQGGSQAFYLPNLVPNGSFELPATKNGEIVSGWTLTQGLGWNVALSPDVHDGATALLFTQTGSGDAEVWSSWILPLSAGDVLNFVVYVKSTGSGSGSISLRLDVAYADGTEQTLTQSITSIAAASYGPVGGSFAIPAGSAAVLGVEVGLMASGSSGSAVYGVDSLSLALVSTQQPFGRMVGTSSIVRPVRFSKPIDIKDAKPANGQKRYDATIEVQEL